MLKNFERFNEDNNVKVEKFTRGNRTYGSFEIQGMPGWFSSLINDSPFYVALSINEAAMEMTALTLGNHPIVGWRKWRVRDSWPQLTQEDCSRILLVQTEGWEWSDGQLNRIGWTLGGKSEMIKTWKSYFENINDTLIGMGASGGIIRIREEDR